MFMKQLLLVKIFVSIFVLSILSPQASNACTALMAGKKATADGSVLMAWCNDGNRLSWIEINPSTEFKSGTKIPMLSNRPIAASTLEAYYEQQRKGYNQVGWLEVPKDVPKKTYHHFIGRARHMGRSSLGFNEFGLTIGTEYTPMNSTLYNKHGAFAAGTNHWTTSMAQIALMKAKTAREAIKVMGALAEEHGFLYYYDEKVGLSLPIVDKSEAWIMEIFPAGPEWSPGSDKPGAVWCAQKIPDDEFFVFANRSRIEKIDLDDKENFLASPNVYSLAEELGLWNPDEDFIWWKVYAQPGGTWNCLREWDAYNTISPSKNFKATGDAKIDRYPFSVKPDQPITADDFLLLMRSELEGTEWDVTEDPAFNIDGEKSPLARNRGPKHLFDLVSNITGRDIHPERAIATDTTTQWIVVQNRDWMPDIIASSMWYSLGPAYTSVLAPIYPMINELPLSWTKEVDFDKINRDHAAWNFNLVYNLAHYRQQPAMKDIKNVIYPAEDYLFSMRPIVEQQAIKIYKKDGKDAAIEYLTDYCYYWFNQIHNSYDELVDYLLYNYIFEYPELYKKKLPCVTPNHLLPIMNKK